MDDLYTNKKCNLCQIATVARCDIASLLPAEDKEGEERDSSSCHGFPHQKHTESLNGIPEISLYSQLTTANMTFHKETISI